MEAIQKKLKLVLALSLIFFHVVYIVPITVIAQDFDDSDYEDISSFEEATDWSEEDPFVDDMDLNEDDFDDMDLMEKDDFDTEQLLQEEKEFEEIKKNETDEGEKGGDYIDESVIPEDTRKMLESKLLRTRNIAEEEKVNLTWNLSYGAGTGLMIGGWFALLMARTSRDTLRSLGLGIVLGTFMGGLLGTRSVISPNLPRPVNEPVSYKHNNYKKDRDNIQVSWMWKF